MKAAKDSRVIESDYDINPTELYQCITKSDWDGAMVALERDPVQCRTWVVRRDLCRDDEKEQEDPVRFLPLHSACAREPPLDIIIGLLTNYPEGAKIADDNGMLPLHYACANQASPAVIGLLLVHNPQANYVRVSMTGSLPIHLAAQWGVSSPEVMDTLLAKNRSLACAKDNEECTPLELAINAEEYDEKEEVIDILVKAFEKEAYSVEDDSTISTRLSSFIREKKGRKGKGSDARRSSLVITPHSKKKQPDSPLNTTLEFISTLDEVREEIGELRGNKGLQEEGTREQADREWGVMNDKKGKLNRKSQKQFIRASSKTIQRKCKHKKAANKKLREPRADQEEQFHTPPRTPNNGSSRMAASKLSKKLLESRNYEDIVSNIDSSGLLSYSPDVSSLDSHLSYESSGAKFLRDERRGWRVEILSKRSSLDVADMKPSNPGSDSLYDQKKAKMKRNTRTQPSHPVCMNSSKSRRGGVRHHRRYEEEERDFKESGNYGRLEEILEQNRKMKRDLQHLKSKRDAYSTKIDAVEAIIVEISEGIDRMMKTEEEKRGGISKVENDMKETTRARRHTMEKMLKETAISYQIMRKTRPQGIESCLKKQRAAIDLMDGMLLEMRDDTL